jgi:hypothetical protein
MGGRGDDDTTVQRKAQFDFALPCPLGGYKIQPNELMRLASHIIQCPKCGFYKTGGRHLLSAALLSWRFALIA